MTAPTTSRLARVKRLESYLAKPLWLVLHFGREAKGLKVVLHVFAGSDAAGCLVTSRS